MFGNLDKEHRSLLSLSFDLLLSLRIKNWNSTWAKGEEAQNDLRGKTLGKWTTELHKQGVSCKKCLEVAVEWGSLGFENESKSVKREREKETKRKRTVVEGLRAKLESMWQYQSHRSSREKLLTGAHRALIDCELCCRAQPITRAPGDFSGLEHLHAVCRPIRETTQGEESERDRKRKRKKTKRWGERRLLVREREKWDFQIMVSLFHLGDLESPC